MKPLKFAYEIRFYGQDLAVGVTVGNVTPYVQGSRTEPNESPQCEDVSVDLGPIDLWPHLDADARRLITEYALNLITERELDAYESAIRDERQDHE